MTDFQYVIDSSVIIRRSVGQKFDMDSFPLHWKNFDDRIQDGMFVSIPTVKTEIFEKNRAALRWSSENDIMFEVDMTDSKVTTELSVLSAEFPEWYLAGIEKTTPWADPELIAFARAHGIVLVTCENCNMDSEEKNHKIPTICYKLGAYCHIRGENSKTVPNTTDFQCIDFYELIKREKLDEP